MKRPTKGIHSRRKKKKEKKPLGMMDKYLIVVLASLIAFTVTMILTFLRMGSTPDVLVTCVFAALTGECGFMAIIKSMKEKYENKNEEQPEEPDPDPVDSGGEDDGTG